MCVHPIGHGYTCVSERKGTFLPRRRTCRFLPEKNMLTCTYNLLCNFLTKLLKGRTALMEITNVLNNDNVK